MFEYTLENGKKQFHEGLQYLLWGGIGCIIFGVLLGILGNIIKSEGGLIACLVIFGILVMIGAIMFIVGIIKTVFGGIVYHAERTSSRKTEDIKAEQFNPEKKAIDKDIKDKTPINYVDYIVGSSTLVITLENGHRYEIEGFNKAKVEKWKAMTKPERTNWFYSALIKKVSKFDW